MSEIGRRGLLKVIGSVPLAGLVPAPAAVAQAGKAAKAARGKPFTPQFFTAHEFETVRVLADLVIPKDERSGSATDAGVPEFMDFIMVDPLETQREREKRQTSMRGGLAWLDHECSRRFDRSFIQCDDAQRRAVLDDIAWPEKARPEMKPGAAFFTSFRDLTASGFWSSKMGIEDLGYQGNTFVAEWKGCPPEVLKRLGLEDA
ncbi:MAG TPA: gluconate 2-dehydrogenase subunit 3 family protein [Vicinamibacteria bacterium]|nr:gluconate 2-dehydrogenase subunit 3 family protein [Vicinamibacteria bacterium]